MSGWRPEQACNSLQSHYNSRPTPICYLSVQALCILPMSQLLRCMSACSVCRPLIDFELKMDRAFQALGTLLDKR